MSHDPRTQFDAGADESAPTVDAAPRVDHDAGSRDSRRIDLRADSDAVGGGNLHPAVDEFPDAGRAGKAHGRTLSLLRVRAKITSHFNRPCIPFSGVAKIRNIPDIP